MAKVKFDVSSADPEKSVARQFEPPLPGNYKAKILECKPGFKQVDGEPDKNQPRLEIIYEITDKKVKPKEAVGFRLYEYINFSEAMAWKMDQFLQATGVSNKKKRKGTFDTDTLVGLPVILQVRGESQTVGEGDDKTTVYRARPGSVAAATEADLEDEDEEDETEEEETEAETEEETEEESEDEEEESEEEDEEEEEPTGHTEESLSELELKELSAIMTELGHGDPKSVKGKAAKIAWILDAQSEGDDETEEEDEATDYSTWNLAALKKECDDRELEYDDKAKKSTLIKMLEEDDSSAPF